MLMHLLEKLGDPEFQARVWVSGEEWHLAESFGETINLLDDYAFFDVLEKYSQRFPTTVHQDLRAFAQSLIDYHDFSTTAPMTSDTAWHRIVALAPRMKGLVREFWPNVR